MKSVESAAVNQSEVLPQRLESVQEKRKFRKESAKAISFEVSEHAFRDEIQMKIEELTSGIGSAEGWLVSFNAEFKQRYVEYKVALARLVKQAEVFLSNPSEEGIEQVMEIVTKESSISARENDIRSMLDDHLEKFKKLTEYTDKCSSESIFKDLTGKKANGVIEKSVSGSALVLYVYEEEDYAVIFDKKKDWATLSAGIYNSRYPIRIFGKKTEIPLIVISAKMDDELEGDVKEHFAESWEEELRSEWESRTGKSIDDENSEQYERWRSNLPKDLNFSKFILSQMESESLYVPGDDLDYRVGFWEDRNKRTLLHEKQHHHYSSLIIEHEDKDFKLESPESVRDFFGVVLSNCLRGLGDEIIATERSEIEYWSDWVRDNSRVELNAALDDIDGKDSNDRLVPYEVSEQEVREIKKDIRITLPYKLYFFPNDYKKKIFKELQKKIGEQRFKEWDIENMWKNVVVEPFKMKKRQLIQIGEYFLRQSLRSDFSEKIIDLLQVEPVESWTRLYRWAKNDPKLLKLIEK